MVKRKRPVPRRACLPVTLHLLLAGRSTDFEVCLKRYVFLPPELIQDGVDLAFTSLDMDERLLRLRIELFFSVIRIVYSYNEDYTILKLAPVPLHDCPHVDSEGVALAIALLKEDGWALMDPKISWDKAWQERKPLPGDDEDDDE